MFICGAVDNAPNSIFELAFDNVDNQGINGLANIYRFGYADIVAYDDFTSIFDAGDIRGATRGFRFDDLARTKQDIPKLNVVFEGPVYGSYNYAFPIPLAELNANSNMIPNKGY